MANIDKLLNKKKKKKGDKLYPFGVQITIPSMDADAGTVAATTLTYQGSFDRRKLRKMLRKTFVSPMNTNQLDYIIDNFATKLRPVSMQEVLDWAGTDET